MHLGLILTSAPAKLTPEQTLIWLGEQLRAARADALKVVPAWGMPGGWTPATIAAAARLADVLVVRTSWGDPSYDGGRRALPIAARIMAELRPWLIARPDAWVELGNEPLIEDQPTEGAAWDYRWHLDQTITALRREFPRARLIAPAHMRNHLVRLGEHADGQSRWDAICGDQLRRCDALSIHAYTVAQAVSGINALRSGVSASLPIWLTEFALNEPLDPAARGRRYRAILDVLAVEAALLYHLAEQPGADPVHFNPNYRLHPATLAALAAPAAEAPPVTPPATTTTTRLDPALVNERDVRAQLAQERRRLGRGDWQIGVRARTTAITIHWNGPAVAEPNRRGAGALRQLMIDLEWQTRPGWSRTANGADGLQYHKAIDADGVIYRCRDEPARLWHCGHATGNAESLSLHLILGRGQPATDAQWAATLAVIADWRRRYAIPLARVLGHQEWSATDCPGPDLMARLLALRAGEAPAPAAPLVPAGLRRFVVALPAESRATVRQGPGRSFPVAGHLRPGATILVGAVLDDADGQTIDGRRHWAHMALVPDQQSDLGFVHLSALREAL